MTLSRTMQILTAHEKRFRHALSLVAGENLLSPAARWAMSSDLARRVCIPPADRRPPAIWDYPNQKYTRQIEAEAERLAAHALGGREAGVRPLSGNNGAYILIQALVEPGGRIADATAGQLRRPLRHRHDLPTAGDRAPRPPVRHGARPYRRDDRRRVV